MKIQYFVETDTLSIRLNSNPSTESVEIAPTRWLILMQRGVCRFRH